MSGENTRGDHVRTLAELATTTITAVMVSPETLTPEVCWAAVPLVQL